MKGDVKRARERERERPRQRELGGEEGEERQIQRASDIKREVEARAPIEIVNHPIHEAI